MLFEQKQSNLLLMPLRQSPIAWDYCIDRGISPEKIERSIFWTYDFKALLDKATGNDNEVPSEPRMIIPLRNGSTMVGLQSRSFGETKRYDNHKTSDKPIIWVPPWLDQEKRVIIT
jgi:hypothetical protein